MIYIRLFLEFFRVGLFSIGGGLATLPFLYDLSSRTGWFTAGDVADMIAVAESTPGAIGLNMATYAGYITGGIPGGVVASLGLIAPAIIIIYLIAKALKKFQENPYVQYALYGLRAASLAMITAAAWHVFKISILNLDAFAASGSITDLIVFKALILGVALYAAMKKFTKLHPIAFIAASAVIGILLHFGS